MTSFAQRSARVEEITGASALSKRELQILDLLADGYNNTGVAALLFISAETVKSHVRHILGKLDARTRTHAVAIALRKGLIQ